MRKLKRDREGLEPIRLFGSLSSADEAVLGLHDPARLDEFVVRVRESVTSSLQRAGRLHGLRTESLFKATTVALGGVRLLVDEDAGDVYFDDATGDITPPDFRLVDRDGEQLLVEVKAVPPERSLKSYDLRERDVAARERYADMTGAPLFFALYWPGWNEWTLVPVGALDHSGTKRRIDFGAAMGASEMFRLGDAQIMASPPITLSLELEALDEPTAPGTATVRVVNAQMSGSEGALTDDLEANIAWMLFRYGSWSVEQEQRERDHGSGWFIDYVARPGMEEARALAEQQGFIGVGTLSSIYSTMFNEATLSEQLHVEQLSHDPEPGMIGSLIPKNYWDRPGRGLPLWRAEVHPNPSRNE
jgi:hypothetical protein